MIKNDVSNINSQCNCVPVQLPVDAIIGDLREGADGRRDASGVIERNLVEGKIIVWSEMRDVARFIGRGVVERAIERHGQWREMVLAVRVRIAEKFKIAAELFQLRPERTDMASGTGLAGLNRVGGDRLSALRRRRQEDCNQACDQELPEWWMPSQVRNPASESRVSIDKSNIQRHLIPRHDLLDRTYDVGF